jgi:hypothetical protein
VRWETCGIPAMEETTGSRMWRAALAYAKPALARPDTTWANFRIVRGIVRQERHVRIVSLLKLGTTQARRLIDNLRAMHCRASRWLTQLWLAVDDRNCHVMLGLVALDHDERVLASSCGCL